MIDRLDLVYDVGPILISHNPTPRESGEIYLPTSHLALPAGLAIHF